MTTDEKDDLLKQSQDIAYLAIRYADLSPVLSCEEWDGLSAEIGREVVELVLRRVDAVKEAKEVEEEKMDEWLAGEAMVYE